MCCLVGGTFIYRTLHFNSSAKSADTTYKTEQTDSSREQDESEVYIPKFFVRGFFEIKEFLEEKKEEGMINDYSYIAGDYSAYVKVTDDQKQQWIKYSQEEIDKLLAKEYDGFTINVGKDNTSLNMDIQSNSDY